METSLVLKALHIIFVVTWFAGLFYSFRLFVYYSEAKELEEPSRDILLSQYKVMIKRLWYIITWPSAILTLILGTSLIIERPIFLEMPYMHVKLLFVAALYFFQLYGQALVKKASNDSLTLSPLRLRMINEIPTLVLVAVVFLIVLKDHVSWIWGVAGILGLAFTLTLAVKWYKRLRDRDSKE